MNKKPTNKPQFYECDTCAYYHPATWDGDCREDAARFDPNDLDAQFGALGWGEVPIPKDAPLGGQP